MLFRSEKMEVKLTWELTVRASQCDAAGKLGIPAVFALFMDMATEHADALGIGLRELGKRGLFWLAVRTRVRLYRRPAMLEKVQAATWPEKPGRIRCNRDYTVAAGDELLAQGRTEWAVIHPETGKLVSAGEIYPPELTGALTDARAQLFRFPEQ